MLVKSKILIKLTIFGVENYKELLTKVLSGEIQDINNDINCASFPFLGALIEKLIYNQY